MSAIQGGNFVFEQVSLKERKAPETFVLLGSVKFEDIVRAASSGHSTSRSEFSKLCSIARKSHPMKLLLRTNNDLSRFEDV